MTCIACDDRGLVAFLIEGHQPDSAKDFLFALCLCPTGERWRKADNCGKPTNPAWHVWAAQQGIGHDQVVKLEDVSTAEELAAYGFHELTAGTALDAIAAAARARSRKR